MPDSPTPPTDPDGLAVYHVLAKDGQPTGEEVYNAVQGARNMAGQNLVTLIEARFEALQRENAALRTESNSRFEALQRENAALRTESNSRFEELQRENATLRWMMGLGFTAIGILVALMRLLD